MKANKLWKTLAASAMSLALLAGVAALPAMAAPPVNGVVTGTSYTAESTLRVAENIATPDVTLTYTVAPEAPTSNETHSGMNVYMGESSGAVINSGAVDYDYAAAGTNESGKQYYDVTKTFEITTVNSAFKHPGVYKYKITVTATPSVTEGLTVSGAKYLYVFVKEADTAGYEVYSVVMGTGAAKSGEFVTTYYLNGETPNPEDYAANVLVYNSVTGDLGDKTYPFSYSVTVPANCNYQTGTMVNGQFKADGTENKLTNGAAVTLTLKDGQAVMFYGVKDGERYTIAQNDANTMGYKTTVNTAEYKQAVTGNVEKGSDFIAAFVNHRDTEDSTGVTPTGVIMNIAPYALMVVIAVAGVMVFMRKRVEE